MNTKHKDECTRVFKKYDPTCPRCQELIKGSPPREGWQKSYYEQKAREEKRTYSSYCSHGVQHLNPGGYCNICGHGRDFS